MFSFFAPVLGAMAADRAGTTAIPAGGRLIDTRTEEVRANIHSPRAFSVSTVLEINVVICVDLTLPAYPSPYKYAHLFVDSSRLGTFIHSEN